MLFCSFVVASSGKWCVLRSHVVFFHILVLSPSHFVLPRPLNFSITQMNENFVICGLTNELPRTLLLDAHEFYFLGTDREFHCLVRFMGKVVDCGTR